MNTNRGVALAFGVLLCLGTTVGRAVDVLTEPSLWMRPEQSIKDAALSPDGAQVVAVGKKEQCEVQVSSWDAATGELIRVMAENEDYLNCGILMRTTFSPAGTQVLVDGYLADVLCEGGMEWSGPFLWTVNVNGGGMGNLFERLCSNEAGRTVAWAWSTDGSRIATLVDETPYEEGTPDRIRIWDAETGEMELMFTVPEVAYPHQSPVWLQTGNRIATAHSDGMIRLWDTTTGRISASMGPFGFATWPTMLASPDGNRAVDTVPRELPYEGHPRIWDLRTGAFQVVDYLFPRPHVSRLSFSRDGRLFLASVNSPAQDSRPVDVFLFDTSTGALLAKLEGAGDLPSQSSFSDDARRVLTLSSGGVAIWDLSDVLAKPRMSIGETGPEIRWYLGTVQFASTVDGPWTDLPAASPFPLSPIGEKGFFRVRVEKER